tara:strand:- start:45315 stop:46583 length:1269 start_codon:yes stop_codon:yes gene_type:complete
LSVHNKVKSYILSNSIGDNAARKIGVEVECFVFDKNYYRIPVNKGSIYSASDLLEELNSIEKISNASFSLEPGGQIEWASPACETIQELDKSFLIYKKTLDKILDREGYKSLFIGVDPLNEPRDVELIKLVKYQLMDKNMEERGSLGKWMMRNTCSIQINYDIKNGKDLEESVYILDCLHPVFSYLFSHSPFQKGEVIGNLNLRNHIWENTDDSRCKSLINHGIIDKRSVLDAYIDFVLHVPGIFKLDSKNNIQKTEFSLGEDLRIKYSKGLLSQEDIKAALHQIFTNVRLKNLIEVRDIDCLPFDSIMAPVAFVTGLIDAPMIREKLLSIFNSWTLEDKFLWNDLAKSLSGDVDGPGGKSFLDWVKIISEISIGGLKARKHGEEKYFSNFFENILLRGPLSFQKQNNFKKSGKLLKKYIFS